MDILQQLNQIAQERDISLDELKTELEEALAIAYKKFVGATGDVTVHLDPKTGWKAFLDKEVVGVVTEPSFQIGLVEARKRKPDAEVGDFISMEVDPNRFGRIAAQTFKQVLSQKLREAETRHIHDILSGNVNEVVSGVVTRREGQSIYIQIGKIEAELPKREQVPTERYRPAQRVKVYLAEVGRDVRGPQLLVSRTHPGLLRRLFELEVPEIFKGIVEIKSIAREAGYRSKVAVYSRQEGVDPVGACVGMRGIRIQNVVNELNGERIDVVQWDPEPSRFVANALSPAQVVSVVNHDEENTAEVVVPDRQLSLAIGKEGQNARLAAKLTGWRIDIKSQSAYEAELAEKGITPEEAAAAIREEQLRRSKAAAEKLAEEARVAAVSRQLTPEEEIALQYAQKEAERVEEPAVPEQAAATVEAPAAPAAPGTPGKPAIRFAEELVRTPLEALSPVNAQKKRGGPPGRRRTDEEEMARIAAQRKKKGGGARRILPEEDEEDDEYADLIR